MNLNALTFGELACLQEDDYVRQSVEAMKARFSKFVLTTEQLEAWTIGFRWIYQIGQQLPESASSWLVMPEFVAPLISGRPDLVVVSPRHLLVIEMKTGELLTNQGKKQVLDYAQDLWGKLKGARERIVLPVLLSKYGDRGTTARSRGSIGASGPSSVITVDPSGLASLLREVDQLDSGFMLDQEEFFANLLYSPRPSVVQAATSLVAQLEDKNVVTGLSTSEEIDRLIGHLVSLAKVARDSSQKKVAIVSGAPGAGKTLVGLRLAHEPTLQQSLADDFGTPLYLTGNATLVEVLVESLARDESRRTGNAIDACRANANSKVKLVHGVVGADFGIESNVVIFDEGQRIWTAERMRTKRGDKSLGSEALEILVSMANHPWALVVVLMGEGQEINTGEAGAITWVEAIADVNQEESANWELHAPAIEGVDLKSNWIQISESLELKNSMRTDNAANVSEWVRQILLGNESHAREIRQTMREFPIYVCRDLQLAKEWIQENRTKHGGTSGVLASSKSKRLFLYGVDVVADADRGINWGSWYLNSLPNLSSSEALELAATEFKCQGLELDWTLVCWSWDLVLTDSQWTAQYLDARRARWREVSHPDKTKFQFNAYRVLLTRCRKGMVIWVPQGGTSMANPNMDMDEVEDFLIRCGAVPLNAREPSLNH